MLKGRWQGLWVPAVFCTVASFAWAAQPKLAKASDSEVSFTLIGPAGMKIVGTGNELRVNDDGQAVKVSVPLASMKTGISIRDKHMHEKYLQTPNFPSADLQVPRASLKIPAAGSNISQDAQGTLTLHGKTKPVTFHYTSSRDGSKMKVQGTMHINMNEFGIEVPVYLGVTVKPDVDVATHFDVTEE